MSAPTFPAPAPDNVYSLRFYKTGTATANFTDSKWGFEHPYISGEQAWSHYIRVVATSGTNLEISFDGTNVHGWIKGNSDVFYYSRYEGGISIRGAGGTYVIEAW